MKFKYLEYITSDNESVIIGKKDINVDSKWQLVRFEGINKPSTKMFRNESLDSQLRIFKGNRLPERQILITVLYQNKNPEDENFRLTKELETTSFYNIFSTTDMQTDSETSKLILVSRNNIKYLVKGIVVDGVKETDTSKAQNNYVELDITLRALDPYIELGDGGNLIRFDLSSSIIKTDFVQDTLLSSNTALEFELEGTIEGEEILDVRDGYISNNGIFYALDNYNEDINITNNGQFWLTDSLEKIVFNAGARIYPIIKIYGYVVNPNIKNVNTGITFSLDIIINEGEYVEVDMLKKTAFLIFTDAEGIEERQDVRNLITQESQWMFLKKGENNIEVTFSQAEEETFKLEVIYNTQYEGIGV